MDNDIKMLRERIISLLNVKDYTIYKLVNGDSKRTTLGNQINGNTMVSFDTLNIILNTFPEVSAEWLLRGEGTVDKSGHFAPHIYTGDGSIVQTQNNSGDATITTPSQFELYGKDVTIAAKDAEIANLHEQIIELKQDKEKLHLLLQAFTHKC